MVRPTTQTLRRDLAAIGTAVGTDVQRITRRATSADIDAWFAGAQADLERITGNGFNLSARLGAGFITQSAIEAGVAATFDVPPAVLDAAQLVTSLRVSGPVAFKTNIARSRDPATALKVMGDKLVGSSQRLAMLGGRSTINHIIDTDDRIIGYRRITSAGACDFCLMLARRGPVFKSAASAATVVGRGGRPRGNRSLGRPFHDNCRCVIEPIFADGSAGELQDPTGRNLVARNEARAGRLARRARIDEARARAREQLERERAEALGSAGVDAELLDRWGVSADQWLEAKRLVKGIKSDIRAVAKSEADDLGAWLRDNDLYQITRPDRLRRSTDIFGGTRSVRDQAGYDFLENLDDAELRRIRERMVDSNLFSPDLLAEQVRRKTQRDMTDDEALDWLVDRWLHEDALRSVASGRVPRYADPNNLIPGEYDLEGYELERLFGVDLDDAIGHVAQVQQDAGRRYAARTLGEPDGTPPWQMDADDYVRELEAVEETLATTQLSPGVPPPTEYTDAAERIRELVPPDLDVAADANAYEVHEVIRLVAQTAGVA